MAAGTAMKTDRALLGLVAACVVTLLLIAFGTGLGLAWFRHDQDPGSRRPASRWGLGSTYDVFRFRRATWPDDCATRGSCAH